MAILAKDAAEAIRKHTKLFEAYIQVGAALDEIGSLDNALAESKKRLDEAKKAETDLGASISALRDEIEALTGKKSDASVLAKKMVKDAELQAASIVEKAKADAAAVMRSAQDSAALVVADSEKRAADMNASILGRQAELDVINAEIADKAKERTSLQKAIDAIKSKFV